MNHIFRSILLGSFCALSIIACGDKDEESNSNLISMADLQGVWQGECRAIGSVWGKTVYSFTDSTFTYSSSEYRDSTCTTVDNFISGRGSLVIPGDTSATDGTRLAMMDFKYVAFSWSFVASPSLAVDWSKICENATIQNSTLDVLDKKCTSGTSVLNFAANAFGSLWSSEGKIYVTDINSNGRTIETRSMAVDKIKGALTKLVVDPVVE